MEQISQSSVSNISPPFIHPGHGLRRPSLPTTPRQLHSLNSNIPVSTIPSDSIQTKRSSNYTYSTTSQPSFKRFNKPEPTEKKDFYPIDISTSKVIKTLFEVDPNDPDNTVALRVSSRRYSQDADDDSNSKDGKDSESITALNTRENSKNQKTGSSLVLEGYNSSDEHAAEGNEVNVKEEIRKELDFENLLFRNLGLRIFRVKEDGACLFRAIAHQITGNEEKHELLRSKCLNYLAEHKLRFAQFITEDFDHYVTRKRRVSCYGNNVEIQALADIFNRKIFVYQYSLEPLVIEPSVEVQKKYGQSNGTPMRVSYHQRNHYNSVIDEQTQNLEMNTLIFASNDTQFSENSRSDSISVPKTVETQTLVHPSPKIAPEAAAEKRVTFKSIPDIPTPKNVIKFRDENNKEYTSDSSMDEDEFRDLQHVLALSLQENLMVNTPKERESSVAPSDTEELSDSDIYDEEEALKRAIEESRREYIESRGVEPDFVLSELDPEMGKKKVMEDIQVVEVANDRKSKKGKEKAAF